jgi:hypothetical protein
VLRSWLAVLLLHLCAAELLRWHLRWIGLDLCA